MPDLRPRCEVARDGFAAHVEPEWVPDERALHVRLRARPGGGSLIAPGAAPGMPVEVVVKGRSMTVELLEGEHRVANLDTAEGPASPAPGRASAGQLSLVVVEVVGDVALFDYFPSETPDRRGSRDASAEGRDRAD